MELMFQPLKRFAIFNGRARRKEYWLFALFIVLVSFVLGLIEGASGAFGNQNGSVLSSVFMLIIFIPSLAVGVRRLHDLDKNGWFMLLFMIPIVNIGMTIYFCFKGTEGTNRFGPDPLMLSD